MRVIVTLTIDGIKETRIEGNARVFDYPTLTSACNFESLPEIGMWLSDWKYQGHGGPNHKSKIFIPWTSALFIEEVVDGGKKVENKTV